MKLKATIWLMGSLLAYIIASAAMWYDRHGPTPAEALSEEIRSNGAIMASVARIERRSGKVRGWNTLVLVQPAAITRESQVQGPCFLVVPQNPWVAGQADVAVKTRAEFKRPPYPHVILPSKVRVFSVDAHNVAKEVDSHGVNFLRIDDPPGTRPVR